MYKEKHSLIWYFISNYRYSFHLSQTEPLQKPSLLLVLLTFIVAYFLNRQHSSLWPDNKIDVSRVKWQPMSSRIPKVIWQTWGILRPQCNEIASLKAPGLGRAKLWYAYVNEIAIGPHLKGISELRTSFQGVSIYLGIVTRAIHLILEFAELYMLGEKQSWRQAQKITENSAEPTILCPDAYESLL